jgi:hypothetical protein
MRLVCLAFQPRFSGELFDKQGSGRSEKGGLDAESSRMNVFDLIKATIFCGGVAFLFYSFPVLGQVLVISLLSVLWLSYARKTILTIRGKRFA